MEKSRGKAAKGAKMSEDKMNTLNCTQFRDPAGLATSSLSPMISSVPNVAPNPPPIPPRRTVPGSQPYGDYRQYGNNYYGGFGGYGSSFGYRGYGGYGGYNNFGYSAYPGTSSYGGYLGGPSGDAENRFVQFAEESTRSTFQSIESLVQAFSSITMMLESTFYAVTNSFRALLSVAENLGRLRSTFGQLLSTFALLRMIRWCYRKITYMLGLRYADPEDDAIWQQSMSGISGTEKTSSSTWSALLFLSISLSIPYFIYKLRDSMKLSAASANNPSEWTRYTEPVYSAIAQYDFVAASREELNLKAGQKVWLAPMPLQPTNMPGWCRATDNKNIGLIPANYVTIVGQLKKKSEVNRNVNDTGREEVKTNVKSQDSFTDLERSYESETSK